MRKVDVMRGNVILIAARKDIETETENATESADTGADIAPRTQMANYCRELLPLPDTRANIQTASVKHLLPRRGKKDGRPLEGRVEKEVAVVEVGVRN